MKTPKIKLIITLLIIAAGVALFIIGYCVLPETLVMQITASGQGGNTMPKLLGLLIPFAINTIFTIIYFKSENLKDKNLVFALLSLFLYVFVFAFNL